MVALGYAKSKRTLQATRRVRRTLGSAVILLPAYDEYTIAYKDHNAILHPVYRDLVVAAFGIVIVIDGQIVGAWKRVIEKHRVLLMLEPFRALSAAEQQALSLAVRRYQAFSASRSSWQERSMSMQKIRVISRKYDGRMRDEYEAFLCAEDHERLVVYAPAGTLSYDRRAQIWIPAPDGLLEIYFKQRWYNVWHICEQWSNNNQIYSNLAMPAVRTADGIEWIDLDLDYRVHMDGRIERLDEDEYRAHIVSMGYSVDVQTHVQAACAEIEALYQQRADPFNYAEQVARYQRIKAEHDR